MNDSEAMSDEEARRTPPEILNAASNTVNVLIPEKSRKKYEKVYRDFMEWRINKGTISFSENVVLVYFDELSAKFKATSMWSFFSMLKCMLQIKHEVDIGRYNRLNAFLRRKSEGYKAKKAKTFTSEEIQKFLDTAPDKVYLFTKAALIFGIMGGCRRHELYNVLYADVQVFDSTILVNVRKTKTKIDRTFTITDPFCDVVKKYTALRPSECEDTGFFLKYSNGKCFNHKVGINKFGALGKTIAEFLNLPDPDMYTGHCFRRTSAQLIKAGGDNTHLKINKTWKSATVTENLTDDKQNEVHVSNTVFDVKDSKDLINMLPGTSNKEPGLSNNLLASGQLQLSNCTININNYFVNK